MGFCLAAFAVQVVGYAISAVSTAVVFFVTTWLLSSVQYHVQTWMQLCRSVCCQGYQKCVLSGISEALLKKTAVFGILSLA
jgi:hypothetical protein